MQSVLFAESSKQLSGHTGIPMMRPIEKSALINGFARISGSRSRSELTYSPKFE